MRINWPQTPPTAAVADPSLAPAVSRAHHPRRDLSARQSAVRVPSGYHGDFLECARPGMAQQGVHIVVRMGSSPPGGDGKPVHKLVVLVPEGQADGPHRRLFIPNQRPRQLEYGKVVVVAGVVVPGMAVAVAVERSYLPSLSVVDKVAGQDDPDLSAALPVDAVARGEDVSVGDDAAAADLGAAVAVVSRELQPGHPRPLVLPGRPAADDAVVAENGGHELVHAARTLSWITKS